MQLQTAYDIQAGKIRPEIGVDCTLAEAIQLAIGACLTNDDNIVCLRCNKPNECCHCDEDEEIF